MRNRILICTILFYFILINVKANDYKYHQFFIYTFINYTEWPSDYDKGDITIGVLGNHPIVGELNKMSETKKINYREFNLKVFRKVKNIKKCHLLFVPFDKSSQMSEIIQQLRIKSPSTLLVTEKPDLLVQGSMINFIMINGKLYFEINRKNAEKSRLSISPLLDKFTVK